MDVDRIFVPPCEMHTPVLLIVYKRLDSTRKVLQAIREASPPRLYIAADGPKPDAPGEAETVEEVRQYLLDSIDWNCEVKTLFRESNLGCRAGVCSGIDWFFENEQEGIILEDDTLPTQCFFWFCQELLEKYRNDERIGMISGNNRYENESKEYDYFFSRHGLIWGWATWRKNWLKNDINIASYNMRSYKLLKKNIGSKAVARFWMKNFDKVAYDDFDTWDYQWSYTRYLNRWLTIRPRYNLVKNIGFDSDATHTKSRPQKKFTLSKQLEYPFKGPDEVSVDLAEDQKLEEDWLSRKMYWRLRSKVARLLR